MENSYDSEKNIKIYPEDAILPMTRAGKLAAETLDFINPYVKPGVSTGELDKLMHDFIVANGAVPAPLNYRGYPNATCISLNHVVCHGIPSFERNLKNTDILNIDVTVILDGWYGDTSRMYFADINHAPIKAKNLVRVTYDCLELAINAVKPGIHLGDIGAIIQEHAESYKFSVVRDFVGHGIGRNFHEPPNVYHFGKRGTGPILRQGMIFTIEPMINAGGYETKVLADGWTAVTRDKSLSAQAEHTVMVGAEGAIVFTNSPQNLFSPFKNL